MPTTFPHWDWHAFAKLGKYFLTHKKYKNKNAKILKYGDFIVTNEYYNKILNYKSANLRYMGKIKGFLFAVRHREILMTDLG